MSRRDVSKRAAWGIADQAFSSGTNFALSAIVANQVSPSQFGGFALVFATYLLALGVVRSAYTVPLLVRFSGVPEDEWRSATRAATGTAVAGGVAAAAAVAVASLIFPSTRAALLALAVSLPLLLLQDSWRHAFLAKGITWAALANDVAWALFLVPGLGVPIALGADSAAAFVLGWGLAGGAAGLVGIAQARVVPHPGRTRHWVVRHWDLAGHQLGEFAANSGSNQFVMYMAGSIGLVTAGALRAGQVLLNPLNVAFQGMWIVAIPEQVRTLRERPTRVLRVATLLSLALAALGATYAGLLKVFADRVGPLLLGETWPNAEPLIVPLGLAAVAWGLWVGPTVTLRAMEEARRSFRARVVNAVLTVVCGAIGLRVAGAEGGAWGIATANALSVPFWWWHLLRAARRRPEMTGVASAEVVGEPAV